MSFVEITHYIALGFFLFSGLPNPFRIVFSNQNREMKAHSRDIVNNVKQDLRNGYSARSVANSLGTSISSVLKIRKSDRENIPDLLHGRPSKISDRTRRSLARQFNTGELESIKEGERYIKAVKEPLLMLKQSSVTLKRRK